MLNFKNISIIIIYTIYFIVGAYLSVTNGISHDQYHEQLNWNMSFDAIKSFFNNDNGYQQLLDYKDKYHGVGFHYFSQPIQFLTHNLIGKIDNVNFTYAYYISRHLSVFLIFNISGFFFYLLSLKISNNREFSLFTTAIFFLYPYFFGHAQINGKDIPFLSLWLICTYYLFKIIENFYEDEKTSIKNIIFITFFTAFLISIRITGIMILLEYLIAVIILINLKNIKPLNFFLKNSFFFIIFTILLVLFIYILNPIFWLDPTEFFKSITWMGKYYHDICTLTLGECMNSLNLPSSYYFIWLFFKLPILVLIGLLIYPII